MKKFSKLLLSGVLVAGLAFGATSCSSGGDKPTPPTPSGDKTTIIDAYDKDGRPNYDEKFDYESGYTPSAPATEAKVTISASSSIRFKEGKSETILAVGKTLKQEDFDESTLGGKTVGGVAIVTQGEDGEETISSFVALDDFVPSADTTIVPYFAPAKGESLLWGSNGKDYLDGLTADSFSDARAIVNGFMGMKVDYAGEIKSGNSVRFKATMPIESEQNYKFRYTFVNYGTEKISFNVYQMTGGKNYDDPATAVASELITLEPGASSEEITLSLASEKNDTNALTGLRFTSDAASASLGIVMSVENVTESLPVKITLDLPEGFSVKEYVTDVFTNAKLTLPSSAQIENNTGHNLLYWVDGDGNKLVNGTRITGDLTVKPVLSETVTITYDLPEGFTIKDTATEINVETETTFELPKESQIENTTGRKFIRWVDEDGNVLKNGFTVKGNLTIRAELSVPATIDVVLPDGLTLSSDYNRNIQTGDVITAPSAEQITGTLPDGREIAGWYVVGSGNQLITATTTATEEQVTIAPYFTRRADTAKLQDFGDSTDGKDLVFCNVQASLKPMNVYGNGIDLNNFSAISSKYQNDTVVRGGANGYAELGNVLSYNGKISADAAFRCGTIISNNGVNSPVVKLNMEHTFIYNFENFGKTKIHFTIQGVNSGTNVEGPVKEIVLEPGESTTVQFSVTYTQGATNKNVMGYFTVKEDVEDMKLGVSVSVILGQSSVSVTGADEDGFTLKDSYLSKKYKEGDKLILPTADDYTDERADERTVIGWKNAVTGKTLTENTILTQNIQIAPVFKYLKLTITVKNIEYFTVSDSWLKKERREGDKLILPTADDYTDGKSEDRRVIGWKNSETGEELTNDFELTENIEIEPIFEYAQKVTVTLGNGLKFASGESFVELKIGEKLPELGAVSAGFQGFYADGQVVAAEDYTVPETDEAVKLIPVYNTLLDYTYMKVGSGSSMGYNTDQVPGKLQAHADGGTMSYVGGTTVTGSTAQLIHGKDGEYYVYGSYLSDTAKNYAGTAIRFDSKHTVSGGITQDTVVEFSYVIENKGDSELWFSLYQISGSSEYKADGGYYQYETRYRIEVRLAPGESKEYIGQYLLGKNGNALTYIVFEKDVDNFSFGLSIGEKALTDKATVDEAYANQAALSNPATLTFDGGETGITVNESYLTQFRAGRFLTAPTAEDYIANGVRVEKWQVIIDGQTYDLPANVADYTSLLMPSAGATLVAVLAQSVTVTYEHVEGLTYEGGKTEYTTGETLSLPAITGTVNGRTAAGWYNKATGKIVTEKTVLSENLTLAPYYASSGTELTPLSGANSNDKYGPDSLSGCEKSFTKETDMVIEDEKGIVLGYGAMSKDAAFRFKTAYSVVDGKTYKFSYIFKNFGTEDLTFTVYQVKGGTATEGMPSETITLKAGEARSVELTLAPGKNGNILTYFVIGNDISSLSLGVAMSLTEVTVEG